MASSTNKNSRIEYGVISTSKAEETSDFLLKNFFPKEPISQALGLPINQVTRWFPSQVRDCLKLGISVGATDETTGELVGVAINIIAEKNLQSTKSSGEKEGRGLLDILDADKEGVMVKIAEFLGILNQVPDSVYGPEAAKRPQPMKTFNCIYLAVLPAFGGQGIGQRLVEESEKICRQQKISVLQVDTTSEFSYRIFRKCGYEIVREIELSDYLPGIEKVDGGVHQKGRILLKNIII